MCPPKRPLARIGSSRLTIAPGLKRENEVRFHVSSARSAPNESDVISTAVRQTPLTATLSPFFNSLTRCEAATVSRRFPFSLLILVTRPTSSMMPVNMEPPSFTTETQSHREGRKAKPRQKYQDFNFSVSLCLCGDSALQLVYGSFKYPSTAKSSPKRCRRTDFTQAASPMLANPAPPASGIDPVPP